MSDIATETETDWDTETEYDTEGTGDTEVEQNATKGTGTTRRMPTYGLGEPVDELPEEAPTGGKRNVYFDLLAGIANNADLHGRWVPIAEFKTRNGARDAASALNEGARTIPEGEWEFESRREGVGEARVSRLYAKYA